MILSVILYGAGYTGQFISNYKMWESQGNFAGNGSAPAFPNGSFFVCVFYAFTGFPYNLYGLFFCIAVLVVIVFMILRLGQGGVETKDKERNFSYSSKGSYGTAGFMTEKEMLKVLKTFKDVKQCDGTILGTINNRIVAVPNDSKMNRNIAVYGASGSSKSRAYARNRIFSAAKNGESLICTDPKSELYEDMAVYLSENSYTVKVFNLVSPECSDAWNCLCEIEGQELMAQLFTDVVIKNTTANAKQDHFWDSAESNLLKALVLFVEQGFPPEAKNIGQVYKLLSMHNEKELNAMFDVLPNTHPAKAPYAIYKQAGETVRSGIIIGLGSRLQVFQNRLIRMITSYDDIDLTLPGKEKCAYFIVSSDQDSTFDFLVSLFMSFVFIKLVRFADKHCDGGRLPVPVHILGDELPNIGVIPDLTKKISTIRSRNISMSVIFQNIAQMKNRYPYDQWQEILGNCVRP